MLVGIQFGAISWLCFTGPLICRSLFCLFAELFAIVIIMAGIFHLNWKSFSVFPEPRPDGQLETTGIYGIIRHPMYAGVLLISTLLIWEYPETSRIIAGVLLTVVILVKIRNEEKWLANRYPQFGEWKSRTNRLIPFIW